jgi:Polyketide cyclase / dehydrase and lipid transport
MRIQAQMQTTINAPASKVWSVLAHEFDKIDRWSSGITESIAITDGSIPEGVAVSGRVCLSPKSSMGIDEVREDFTYYDEQSMRFGYKAADLPSFIKSAENNWSVRSLEENKSIVEFNAVLEVGFLLGLLIQVLKPILLKSLGGNTLEELKYYVENDEAHPRKLKAIQKQRETA